MTNKRHAHSPPHQATPPRAPSLDPDTGEPPETTAASAGPAASQPAPEASEVEVWKDKYLRLAAEYDNFRKRSAKERAEVWGKAQADVVQRLVDGLDDLARFAHVDRAQADAKTIHDGVELVERKLWKELEALGVARIDQVGVPFDPNLHEAVTTQPADHPAKEHTAGVVLQSGYRLGGVLIRPARVVVLTWQGEAA